MLLYLFYCVLLCSVVIGVGELLLALHMIKTFSQKGSNLNGINIKIYFMTDKQLIALGIHPNKTRVHKFRYYVAAIDVDINIYKNTTPQEVIQELIQAAIQIGIAQGKEQKAKEIKDVLNIRECTGHSNGYLA